MAGLHTKKTVIVAYTIGFVAIMGCLIIKQKPQAAETSEQLATELDLPVEEVSEQPKTFAQVVEQRLKPKRVVKNRSRFPLDVAEAPEQGVYNIYTAQGLDDFITSHTDKPVVVKFANKKACSPCKALEPTYLLSAKFLAHKAYFAQIDEGEFDDVDYFFELAPIIPAFKIYIDGEVVAAKEFQGLRSRTHIKEEIEDAQQEHLRKKAASGG